MSTASVIVRLDDVCSLSAELSAVWDLLEQYRVPVHLGVIPARLKAPASGALCRRAQGCRVPVSVHQHGFRHTNHGTNGRRYEFDDARGYDAQLAEIQRGRMILEQAISDWFEPIFSPPWNRCGASTLEALSAAGFTAVSMVIKRQTPIHPAVTAIPVTVDPVRWRPNRLRKSRTSTRSLVLNQLAGDGYAGLCLHPQLMDEDDCEDLAALLNVLAERGVEFPTMRCVADRRRQP